MADFASNSESLRKLFQALNLDAETLLKTFQELAQAADMSEQMKSGIPLLEMQITKSKEYLDLVNAVAKAKERDVDLSEDLKVVLNYIAATTQKAQAALTTQAEKFASSMRNTSMAAIEEEKALVESLALLKAQGGESAKLASNLVKMKALEQAKNSSKALWDNTKGITASLFDMNKVLEGTMNFFGRAGMQALVQKGATKALNSAIDNALKKAGKAAGPEGEKGEPGKATKEADKAAAGVLTDVGKDIAKKNDETQKLMDKVTDTLAKNPVAALALAAAMAALALDMKFARARLRGSMNALDASLIKGARDLQASGLDYLGRTVPQMRVAFFASAEEVDQFTAAVAKAGVDVTGLSNKEIVGLRNAMRGSNQTIGKFTEQISTLTMTTGLKGARADQKLTYAKDLYYRAIYKASELQKTAGISTSVYMEAWEQAGNSLADYAKNQEWLQDATARAASGLDKMGMDVRQAANLVVSITNSFANVNDAMKILAMPGKGLNSLAEFPLLNPQQMMDKVMGTGPGRVFKQLTKTSPGAAVMFGGGMFGLKASDIAKGMKSDLFGAMGAGAGDKKMIEQGRIIGEQVGARMEKVIGAVANTAVQMEVQLNKLASGVGKIGAWIDGKADKVIDMGKGAVKVTQK